jgi:hypothetical protein
VRIAIPIFEGITRSMRAVGFGTRALMTDESGSSSRAR